MNEKTLRRWQNLVAAAYADEKLNPEEQAFLDRMRRALGVQTVEVEAVSRRAAEKPLEIDVGGGPAELRRTLRDVISVALADGVIDSAERRMIERVADHIGLNREELDALIEICRLHPGR